MMNCRASVAIFLAVCLLPTYQSQEDGLLNVVPTVVSSAASFLQETSGGLMGNIHRGSVSDSMMARPLAAGVGGRGAKNVGGKKGQQQGMMGMMATNAMSFFSSTGGKMGQNQHKNPPMQSGLGGHLMVPGLVGMGPSESMDVSEDDGATDLEASPERGMPSMQRRIEPSVHNMASLGLAPGMQLLGQKVPQMSQNPMKLQQMPLQQNGNFGPNQVGHNHMNSPPSKYATSLFGMGSDRKPQSRYHQKQMKGSMLTNAMM